MWYEQNAELGSQTIPWLLARAKCIIARTGNDTSCQPIPFQLVRKNRICAEIPEFFFPAMTYPNSFNPATKIKFGTPLDSRLRGNDNVVLRIYDMLQNYPNPFNPQTEIKFGLPIESLVKLVIYDVLGREIAVLVNEKLKAGEYKVNWEASENSSGVYFYKLTSDGFRDTKKMILIK